jgi:hypothetical protein
MEFGVGGMTLDRVKTLGKGLADIGLAGIKVR